METYDLLGVRVAVTDLSKASGQIRQWIADQFKTYVCIAPVSTIVDAQKDPQYKKIVNAAGMVTPDGMPLVWTGRMKGIRGIRRTCGPDLMARVCADGQREGTRHFFYGADEQTLLDLRKRLSEQFSGIQIVGTEAPPYRKIGDRESQDVLDRINEAKPDILWIGLGSPKQDFWMADHRSQLDVPIMIGAGAAFDFLAGTKKRAPQWMQKAGLEWLFRLCSEPRRLWKRYLFGNLKFLFYLVRDFFGFLKF